MIELLEPVARILFFGIGYAIGYFPVILGSLGTIEPGPLERIGDAPYYRSKSEKWWHITYVDEGMRYLPAEGVALVGAGILGMIVALAWLIVKCAG